MSTLLPPAVAPLVSRALGGPITELAPTYDGFSNLTLFATIGGRRCVLKAATTPAKRADVWREAALLPLVTAQGRARSPQAITVSSRPRRAGSKRWTGSHDVSGSWEEILPHR